MKRIILDSNILISYLFLKETKLKLIVDRIIQNNVILISQQTFNELVTTLEKDKIKKLIQQDIKEFLRLYELYAERIDIVSNISDCRDSKDNIFLELAVDGDADIIITGDKDLLTLDPYHKTRIISLKEYINNADN